MTFGPARKARAQGRVERYGWTQAAILEGISVPALRAALEPPSHDTPTRAPRRTQSEDERRVLNELSRAPRSQVMLRVRTHLPDARLDAALRNLTAQGRVHQPPPYHLYTLVKETP